MRFRFAAPLAAPLAALSLLAASGCATSTSESVADSRQEAPPPPLLRTAQPAPAPARSDAPRVLASARIAAVGDVLMHGAVKDAAAAANVRGPDGKSTNHEGYGALFENVAPALRDADLGFANLETPVAPKTDKGSRSFVFNAPPVLLPALEEAGIGVVSFANNHVYDQGVSGLSETIEQLEKAGLPQLGAGRTCAEASKARILDVKGIKIAFIGATRLFNDDKNAGPNAPCAFLLDEKIALDEAKKARAAGAELVLLSVHWGVEYDTAPRKEEVDLAHRLLDGGFDAILGHHPHVLQPVEVYETSDGRVTFVAYSLGNFISNQSRTYAWGVHPAKVGNTRDGVLLRFSAVRKDYGNGVVRTELADLRAEPLWTENNALARARNAKLAPQIRVVHTDSELEKVRADLAAAHAEDQAVKLRKQIELLEARRSIAAGILGEDFLP